MSDFIEVSELKTNDHGYDREYKRWISKYHITGIEPDEAHGQTFVYYYKDEEIRVRETIQQLQTKMAE